MTHLPNTPRLELLGEEIGILLLNSFPGANSWAHSLHSAGYSVLAPNLNPSPLTWDHMDARAWQEKISEAKEAFTFLQTRCQKIFLAGFDSDGSVALKLAITLENQIEGLILIETSLPPERRVFKKWGKIDEELFLIEQPLLLLYCEKERDNNQDDSIFIADEVSSPFIREIILEESFHTSKESHDGPLLVEESIAFISEISSGVWINDINDDDDSDLIDAEFASIVAGLSLDESTPSTYLDELDLKDPDEHFTRPDPRLEPIADKGKRNAIFAMIAGPIYAVGAAIFSFDPFGIEPWPGVIAFFAGLFTFLYKLRDDFLDDDGAIL